jgi:hypothetical protein
MPTARRPGYRLVAIRPPCVAAWLPACTGVIGLRPVRSASEFQSLPLSGNQTPPSTEAPGEPGCARAPRLDPEMGIIAPGSAALGRDAELSAPTAASGCGRGPARSGAGSEWSRSMRPFGVRSFRPDRVTAQLGSRLTFTTFIVHWRKEDEPGFPASRLRETTDSPRADCPCRRCARAPAVRHAQRLALRSGTNGQVWPSGQWQRRPAAPSFAPCSVQVHLPGSCWSLTAGSRRRIWASWRCVVSGSPACRCAAGRPARRATSPPSARSSEHQPAAGPARLGIALRYSDGT